MPGPLVSFSASAPDGTLNAWPISPCVNSPRNNDASLIEPVKATADGATPKRREMPRPHPAGFSLWL